VQNRVVLSGVDCNRLVGEASLLLLPPHRTLLPQHGNRQSVRFVAGDDGLDDAGAKEREVEELGDVGALQTDRLGEGLDGREAAGFEQVLPTEAPGQGE